MHDASDIPWDLIADTLAGEQGDGNGERPRAERDVLDRWLAEHPTHRQLFAIAQSVWATDSAWTNPDVAMLKAKVSARIGVDVDRYKTRPDRRERVSPLAPRGGNSKTQPLLRGTWYALAGMIVGALLIVAGWHIGTPRLAGHQWGAVSKYVTGSGERANITLPDGSTVALDVASRLDVPADYATGNHALRLTGEAMFTARHDGGTPFTVVAGTIATQVLGTTFLVRHYPTDTVTTVVVRDGKVAVRASTRRPVVLTAARQLTVGRTGLVGVQTADPSQFGFVTGVLPIDGLPLRTAIVELDRWYDADIRLGDSVLATRRITGGFTAGSLADLMTALEWTFNLRVVRDGRVLTLFPR